jgi:uncharacterized membrane protein YbhN (UPF0104 family)
VLAMALAMAVYVGLAAYADWSSLRDTLVAYPWRWLPAVLGLVLCNYAGRLLKWTWYLRLVGSRIDRRDATRVFGVGMSMVLTPGKAGELLKSYMVRQAGGTPISITAPIVLAERLTDGLAMIALAAVGLYGMEEPVLRRTALGVCVLLLGVVAVVQWRALALWLLDRGARLPVVSGLAGHARDFYESSYTLLQPRNLLLAVGLGLASWTCEGLAYYLVLLGLDASHGASWHAAGQAVFMFSISTVLGAVVATPGGLGATEASLVALSRRLLGMAAAPATAAALLIRLATLWFGVGIGLACMARWPDLLRGGAGSAETAGA